MIPPELSSSISEVHSLLSEAGAVPHTWSYLLLLPVGDTTDATSSLTLAAAAADAVAEAAAESDGGWWASYLNIFKSALVLVHSTIDAPLRSAGFEQTWGVSIAIFTACKYYY